MSVFDLSSQHQEVSSKIVIGLERLSQAFRVLLWEEAKEHNLSPIQIQTLVYLHFHPPEFGRVSLLAREFGLTQATISDTITSLEVKGLIYREVWPADKRVSLLKLTPAGVSLAVKLSTWATVIQDQVASLSAGEQEVLLKFLMLLIESLQKVGVIAISRMCITCRFFQPEAYPGDAAPHRCHLLAKPLANSELRIDCLEYLPRSN